MRTIHIIKLLVPVISLLALTTPLPTNASVEDWQRSASIMSRGPDDFASETFRQSVLELKKLNPTHVTLIITLTQKTAQSTSLYPGNGTPTDEALRSAIRYIHSLNLKTHLKFHIETEDRAWRAYINPPDSARAAWFSSYGSQLKKYAAIAEEYNVDMMTLGAELTNMAAHDAHSKNTERWNALISDIRSIFSGKLTYCANSSTTLSDWTNEKARIGFWPALDYIGISAYHGMSTSNPTVERFREKWHMLNTNDFSKLAAKYNRPIVLCEVGFRNVEFAHTRLYDYWTQGESHEGRQADLYEALFSYWDNYPYFAGTHLWHWSSNPTEGGPQNTDYTPRGKKAEAVIASWWGGAPNAPIVTAAPEYTNQFSLRARATPKPFMAQKEMIIYAIVDNLAHERSGLIIDIEVYDSAGKKVYQRVHEHKQFAAGQSKTYEAKWTPKSPGLYTIKLGVFKAGWEKAYAWNDQAANIVVGNPEITGHSVEIFSPNESSAVSGIQQLTAAVSNMSVSEYSMYWRVDGGEWHKMSTNGAVKQATVDVNVWTWNTTNTYRIEFMAKNSAGTEIGKKSTSIIVVY